VRPQIVSLITHPQFNLLLLRSCLFSWWSVQGLAFLARSIPVSRIDNQWSCGVVTARFRSFVRSLHHQHRDLHQLTYLYLLIDRDPNLLLNKRRNRNMFTFKKGSIIGYLRHLQQRHANQRQFAFKKGRMMSSRTCLLPRVSTLKYPHGLHLSRWWKYKVMQRLWR
jgi:hypothetical protein